MRTGDRAGHSAFSLPDSSSHVCLWPIGEAAVFQTVQAGSIPARHSRRLANGKPAGFDPASMKVRVLLSERSRLRGSSTVERQALNLDVVGSTPAPGTLV